MMIKNLSIKEASLLELNAVVELLISQFNDHNIPYDRFDLENAVRVLIQDDRLGFALLAYEHEQPIGLAVASFAWTVEYAGKTAWLDELYVLPGKRSRGIGRALIAQVTGKAHAAGCKAIDLEVEHNQSKAEHLYKREGFEKLARTRWVKLLDQ